MSGDLKPKKSFASGSSSEGLVVGASGKDYKEFEKRLFKAQQEVLKELNAKKLSPKEATEKAKKLRDEIETEMISEGKLSIKPISLKPIDSSTTMDVDLGSKVKLNTTPKPLKKKSIDADDKLIQQMVDSSVRGAVVELDRPTIDWQMAEKASRIVKEGGLEKAKKGSVAAKAAVRSKPIPTLEIKEEPVPIGILFEQAERQRLGYERDLAAKEKIVGLRKGLDETAITKETTPKTQVEIDAEAQKLREGSAKMAVAGPGIVRISRERLLRDEDPRLVMRTPSDVARRIEESLRSRENIEKDAARVASLYQDQIRGGRALQSLLQVQVKKRPPEGYTARQIELAVMWRGMQRKPGGGRKFGVFNTLRDDLLGREVKDRSKLRINFDNMRNFVDFKMAAPAARYPEGRLSIQKEVYGFLALMKMEPIGNALLEDLEKPRSENGYILYNVRILARKKSGKKPR